MGVPVGLQVNIGIYTVLYGLQIYIISHIKLVYHTKANLYTCIDQ